MKRALMIVGAVGLTACFPAVRGNHHIVTEARTPGTFEGLSVGSGIHAEVHVGGAWSVELTGDENLLPLIATEVVDGVLQVRELDWIDPTRPILLTVVTPRLSSAKSAEGSVVVIVGAETPSLSLIAAGGDLDVREVRAGSLSLTVSAPARVIVDGAAPALVVDAAGDVELNTARLVAESVTLRGSRGAHGIVYASELIDGRLTDGADFTVVGAPLTSRLTASGGARLTFGH